MRGTLKLPDDRRQFLDNTIERWREIWDAARAVRIECRNDRRFYSIAGAQWEGPFAEQFANRPKLEMNKVHLSLIRIFNNYRNNRISVDFVGKGDAQSDNLAALADGLYRADEEASNAQEAYDTAFDEGASGGFGAWRLMSEYEDDEDEENERQRICFEPIHDADMRVFFDPDARKLDKSDAQDCFILTAFTQKRFEDEFGADADTFPFVPERVAINVPGEASSRQVCYIAEYYEIVEKKETILLFNAIDGSPVRKRKHELDENPEMLRELEATGHVLTGERKVPRKQCRKWVLAGNKVVSGPETIPGGKIPVVPFFGKRFYIDNVEHAVGHVRHAKDAQRLKNMQISKLAYQEASTGVEKPLFFPEQVAGQETNWQLDNVRNFPYLLINPVTDIAGNPAPVQGPVGFTKPPQVSPAMAALLTLADQDIADLLGRQESGEELQSNVSGVAVELVHQRLDGQTFIYMANFAEAMRRCGEIWAAMAKELYVEEGRSMRLLGREGERSTRTLMTPAIDPETAAMTYENDLSGAKFDVTVSVGPSSQVKRAAVVRAMSQLAALSQNPQFQAVFALKAFKFMDVDDPSGREWARRQLVQMGAETPTEEEKAEMQATAKKPDPEDELLLASAEKARADAIKAEADTTLSLAKAEQAAADAAKTAASVDLEDRRLALDTLQAMEAAAQSRQSAQPE